MNFLQHTALSSDYHDFYNIIDIFCRQTINHRELERNANIPRSLWQKLGKAQLLGITADQDFSGQGKSLSHHLIAMSLVSSYSPALGLSYGAHSNLCVHQLNKYGNHAQKNKYLPKLISGEQIGALAMSEVNAGSDVLSMELTAKKQANGDYILSGQKMWITNGPDADVAIVYAKTDKITAFIVDKQCPNWHAAQIIDKLGMRASATSELVFNNCLVPKQNVLGEVDQGVYILMAGLSTERLILTGGPIGIMQKCLKLMHDYMNTRKQFNKTIGNFQLMQAKIAECYALFAAASAWAFNLTQAETINRYDPSALLMFASESACKVANATVQTFGGNGYSEDYDAAALYRDAKLYEIGAGTNEIRKTLVGRYLLEATNEY